MAVNAGKSLASLGGHGDFAARFLLALRAFYRPDRPLQSTPISGRT